MFTGIIEATASVLEFSEGVLRITRPEIFRALHQNQSIAVNGACLSVTTFDAEAISFDVVPETVRRTNISGATTVNLERALPAEGRFEGHVVQGHVDGKITLIRWEQTTKGAIYTFTLPEEFRPYVVEKGSVALNGISLTIAHRTEAEFSVALIPTTLEETNFSELTAGDEVNFEADIMAKYWYKWQQAASDKQ